MTMKEGGVPITPEVLALGWSDYVLIALVSAEIELIYFSSECDCVCVCAFGSEMYINVVHIHLMIR